MTDAQLKKRKRHLDQTFHERYDPKTAFGNIELIKISAELQEVTKILEETEECRNCNGQGVEEHECDCDQCEYEGDTCEDCEGEGRVPRTS